MLLFLENITAWKDSGVWAPVIATVLITILCTWLVVRYWFKHKLSQMEEKYLSAQSRYERTKESYNALAYNNAALRSDRNRWEEERAEVLAEKEEFLQKIEQLEKDIARLKQPEKTENKRVGPEEITSEPPATVPGRRSKKSV